MLNVLPFEMVSRSTKNLLISYISSVGVAHAGMKRILENLQTRRGIVPEDYLNELIDKEDINKQKGEGFLIATGVINKTEVPALWKNGSSLVVVAKGMIAVCEPVI